MKKNSAQKAYEVVIVGGGVTGTSLLFTLARYSSAGKIALIEKYPSIAEVNSHRDSNSQTLHFGDIETNYALEKASLVNEAAELLAAYAEKYAPEAFYKTHKMALAVGGKEVRELEKRYDEFRFLFPGLRKLDRDGIAELEPNVVRGRDPREELLALMSEDGYTMDYKKLSESFVAEARDTGKNIDIFLGEKVQEIRRGKKAWHVRTQKRSVSAKVVVVSTGPHSLIFAQRLGYGNEYGILPVAGSFYRAGNILNGKVYMMQMKKLPFAAVHGDPDVNDPKETRFGPTAKVLPLLERHRYGTMADFLRTSAFTLDGVLSLWKIITDRTIFFYMLKNIAYDLPLIGKRLFLKEARKIVPSLAAKDIAFGKGLGGIRPQVVNTRTKKMEMGEAKIVGEGIIFNITPSPGASVCLATAEKDALLLEDFLEKEGFRFDRDAFRQDLRR